MFMLLHTKEMAAEILVNMDHISTVFSDACGLAILTSTEFSEKIVKTSDPYEEVKKMLLDWQERVRTT